jgi:hypothetical protein
MHFLKRVKIKLIIEKKKPKGNFAAFGPDALNETFKEEEEEEKETRNVSEERLQMLKLAGEETQTWKIGVLSAKLKGHQVEQEVLKTIVKEANQATRPSH